MQAIFKETPQTTKHKEARRNLSPKEGYFFGEADAKNKPFSISRLISGLSNNFKGAQLAKTKEKKPVSKELSIKSGLSPGGQAKRGSSNSKHLADLKAQLVKTEGCLEGSKEPRNPITNGKNTHLKHILTKLSHTGQTQDHRSLKRQDLSLGHRQEAITPAAYPSKQKPSSSPKSEKLVHPLQSSPLRGTDLDFGSLKHLIGGSFRCSDIPEDFEEEVTLKSFKDSAFDRSAIQQLINQRIEEHRPVLLKEENDSDYIKRIKTTFKDNKQFGSFEGYESRKTSPLLSVKMNALEKSANLLAGRTSSKQASKERAVQFPGDRKSSKNLDFSKFEGDRPHFIQIEPRTSSRSKPSSPLQANGKLGESPSLGNKSPQCAKLRQFLETHSTPKNCFQTPLLSQQKSRFIQNLLQKNGIKSNSSVSKKAPIGHEYFYPVSKQLVPDTQHSLADSSSSSPIIKNTLQSKGENTKSSIVTGLPVFGSFKHTRQRTADDGCSLSLAPLLQAQTLKQSYDEPEETPVLEKSSSNKTLKRGASSSAKNAPNPADARLFRDQPVQEQVAAYYKLERESATRRYVHPPKAEIDHFRKVQSLVLRVLRNLRAGRDYEEDLRLYIDCCQHSVFELFEVGPPYQHLFQAESPKVAFTRILKLERWGMVLLFAHRLASEEAEGCPELERLFARATESLAGLQDLLWVWLQRIDRVNHKGWEIELQYHNQAYLDRNFRDLNFFKEIADQTRRYSELLSEMYSLLTQCCPIRRKNLGELQRLRKSDRQVESGQVARVHLRDLAGTRSRLLTPDRVQGTGIDENRRIRCEHSEREQAAAQQGREAPAELGHAGEQQVFSGEGQAAQQQRPAAGKVRRPDRELQQSRKSRAGVCFSAVDRGKLEQRRLFSPSNSQRPRVHFGTGS